MNSDQTQPLHSPPQAIISPSPALSQSSTVFESTPRAPQHRATFARLASVDDGKYTAIKDHEDDITEANPYNDEHQHQGLGIAIAKDGKPSPAPSTADLKIGFAADEHELGLWSPKPALKQSVTSFQSSLRQGTAYEPDTQRLRNRRSFADSLRIVYDGEFLVLLLTLPLVCSVVISECKILTFFDCSFLAELESVSLTMIDFGPSDACASHQHFHHGRRNWLSITILVLAVYATIMSGVFLILALKGPRYSWIRKGGRMTPYVADLLVAFFAKTIELSFATVFVSFLGQVLSRRALMKIHGRGVTLAEMDLRSWVMQPGTMITHFEALKSSIFSFLGIMSLIAAVVAMLYTTASESLVQPTLRYGPWKPGSMQGLVMSSPANVAYLGVKCDTPILETDDTDSANTCLQIQYAAQGYHNYQRYISDWTATSRSGNGSSDLASRPKGFAMLYENTTVTAPWVETITSSVTANFDKYNRLINNVTLALPHSGVPAAARNTANQILQPEVMFQLIYLMTQLTGYLQDLDGQGIYNLRASVPSPAVNVLCAQMTEAELEPIVYTEWGHKLNTTAWPLGEQLGFYQPGYVENGTYLNKTVVDDVFGWGEKYLTSPPVFPKLPLPYNTLLNHTGVYGREAIYLLGQNSGGTFALCSLKVFQTPLCSTEYNASQIGATLEAKCNDDRKVNEHGDMRYIASLRNATIGNATINKDWVSIGQEWANSLSLNAGINDGQASNARLLTELMLTTKDLPKDRPSMAEALAVLASCTLLMSWSDAPFVQFWNYTRNTIDPTPQYFNTAIRAQEYASGGSGEPATHTFYIVLFAVFFLSLICLCYFISQNGLITDFSEPLNLFSLAVNSPPSDLMAGSCGAGPKGQQYRAAWFVNAAGEHLFMENKDDQRELGDEREEERERRLGALPPMSPLRSAYEKMSRRTSWL